MRANRRADTSLERRIRTTLHRRGLRYRKDFPIAMGSGRPVRADVAFPRARVAVFVDGCFWHCCPLHGTLPKTNTEYWLPKLAANVDRDRRVDAQLRNLGWSVVHVWEHEQPDDAAARVAAVLEEAEVEVPRRSETDVT